MLAEGLRGAPLRAVLATNAAGGVCVAGVVDRQAGDLAGRSAAQVLLGDGAARGRAVCAAACRPAAGVGGAAGGAAAAGGRAAAGRPAARAAAAVPRVGRRGRRRRDGAGGRTAQRARQTLIDAASCSSFRWSGLARPGAGNRGGRRSRRTTPRRQPEAGMP